MRDVSRAGFEKSKRERRNARGSLYKYRAHAQPRLYARATQWNNGQPYGQLFHFACNNWRRAGKSKEGESERGEMPAMRAEEQFNKISLA